MSKDQTDYEALASQLTDPETEIRFVGEPFRGQAAADAGRAFLLREYGTESAIKEAMRRGRPRVGAEKGTKSPVVRGAITQEDFEAFEAVMEETGRSQSELVRLAVHEFLKTNRIAG